MPSRSDNQSDHLSSRTLEIGARLEQAPSETLVQVAFKKELADQESLFDAMNRVDIAHTLIMVETGIVPAEAGKDLIGALLELQKHPDDFIPDPHHGDLYTNREVWLSEHSNAHLWLGAGRARREAATSAFLIKLREELLSLAETMILTRKTICVRSQQFQQALMPDYTYLQSAQPSTFGHYLLGFGYPMLRDFERLQELYKRVNRSPAGCGSTNGSRLNQNREALGKLLGFEGIVSHARDAMWQADLPIETSAMLSAILINLDRLAEDLQIFTTEEFGLIELDDRHARASKIMPQKKNPFALTHVRATANSMIGTLSTCAALARTPSGQPDNRLSVYGLLPRAIEDTRDAVQLIGEVVSELKFNEARARQRLEKSFASATDLAEELVLQSGLNWRDAHRLVGRLVREHLEDGDLSRITPRKLATAAKRLLGHRVKITEAALRNALDPEDAIAARTATGGAAPEAMDNMIEECVSALQKHQSWLENCRERLWAAQTELLDKADKFVRGCDNSQ